MGDNFTTPCWFFLNNSETVKAVTVEFCSIQYHLIKDICAKFGISKLPQSLDVKQNSDGGISHLRISRQSLIKEKCHNSGTWNMKLGPVTKLNKRNKTTSKKNWRWRHVTKLWRHCYFFIYGQFEVIWKPDSRHIVCKIYIFRNSNFLSKHSSWFHVDICWNNVAKSVNLISMLIQHQFVNIDSSIKFNVETTLILGWL